MLGVVNDKILIDSSLPKVPCLEAKDEKVVRIALALPHDRVVDAWAYLMRRFLCVVDL